MQFTRVSHIFPCVGNNRNGSNSQIDTQTQVQFRYLRKALKTKDTRVHQRILHAKMQQNRTKRTKDFTRQLARSFHTTARNTLMYHRYSTGPWFFKIAAESLIVRRRAANLRLVLSIVVVHSSPDGILSQH